MVHGLEQIKEMNRNHANWERLVKAGIVEAGPMRRITPKEMKMLREIEAKGKPKIEDLDYLQGPGFSNEEKEALAEYLKRNPISIRIQARRSRRFEGND